MRDKGVVALSVSTATADDAAAVAAIRNEAAAHLTDEFGTGHWSGVIGVPAVLRGINSSRVLVVRNGETIVGTLRLATKRPWAIDPAYFAASERPLYLMDMAVSPTLQRRGAGRQLLDAAIKTAEGWKADAIRLDAYDHPAGAGRFYEKCGFERVGQAAYRGVRLIYYQRLL
ncbi:MAG TPA: GNAT family N-acetyltransferase [Vicinamibacterales bacterium]|nr:GNAT family N-acetyltransferase [Vicinamibacterales bacterium]